MINTGNIEIQLLATSDMLEDIAGKLVDIYKTHGSTVGEIDKSGMREKVDSLKQEGTDIYKQILPSAHQIYFSWPLPKQIRGARQLRVEMAKAGEWSHCQGGVIDKIKEIKTGIFSDTSVHSGSMRTFAYGLRELVKENKNPDQTDPYWDRIKDAVLIEPRPGYAVRCIMAKEDGRGEFDKYGRLPDMTIFNDTKPKEVEIKKGKLKREIDNLVGAKTIFIPVETRLDSQAYELASYRQPELSFEFDVHERYSPETGKPEGRVIKTIKLEEYNPLTNKNAETMYAFFEKHILG